MRVVEDTPTRLVLRVGALRHLVAAFVLGGFGLFLAVLTLDVLSIDCDRARDQCSFESVGVLQGGRSGGSVRLSEIQRLRTERHTARGGGNRVTKTERHGLELVGGRRVELEPRARGVLFDDLLEAELNAFLRSREPTFSAFALHFGHAGFAIPVLLALGCVLLVLAESKRACFDFASGRFAVDARGLRIGRHSTVGALEELVAVEVLPAGAQAGSYLSLRDGRRAKLESGTPDPALSSTLAARLRLPIAQGNSEVIRRAGAASPWPLALGCMLLALSPLGIGVAWWILNAVWGSLL